MGITTGIDADVWVTATPSIVLSARQNCSNFDSGVWKTYRADLNKYWDNSVVPVVQVGTDAKQTLTMTGSPTGGTFTLSFGGNTTATIPWNATAVQVDVALEALVSIGTAGVLVTGGPFPATPIVVEFQGPKGGAVQTLMTASSVSLTGGSSPTVTPTSTRAGIAWVTQVATDYTFQYVGGLVIFNSALASTQAVCIQTGNYFNISQLGSCSQWTLALKASVVDTTIFQTGTWGASQAAMKNATGTIDSFLFDGTMDTQLNNLMVFVLYLVKTSGVRFECYGYLSDDAINSAMSGVITKKFNFVSNGPVYLLYAP